MVLGLQMHGEELKQTRDGPFDTRTLPSRVRKRLRLQALKYPHGVCAHLIHTKSSQDTEPLEIKSLPLEQEHQGMLGEHPMGEHGAGPGPHSIATWEEPLPLSVSYT